MLLRSRLHIFAFLLFLFPQILSAQGNGPVLVEDVRYENLDTEAEAVKNLTQVRPGARYPNRAALEEAVDRDVKRLMQTASFANVIPEFEQTARGVIVTYALREFEYLESVERVGFKNLGWESIQEENILFLQPGGYLNDYHLQQDIRTIEKAYQQKGFHFVQVQTSRDKGTVGTRLTIRVVEGPKVGVGDVHFVGNETFTEGELDNALQFSDSAFFGLFTDSFSQKKLQDGTRLVTEFYRNHGFLNAEVYVGDLEFSDDREWVNVEILIQENERYRIRNISFSGNEIFGEKELREAMELKEGDDLDRLQLESDRRKIRELYGEKAFIKSRVEDVITFIPGKSEMDIRFEITENEQIQVGEILIRGNEYTREKVIRRKVKVYPGELFDQVALERSMRQLQASRFFSPFSWKFVEGAYPNMQDIVIDVGETQTGSMQFAGGYSSAQGVVGMIEVTQRNFDIADWPDSFGDIFSGEAFRGGGQFMRVRLTPGTRQTSVQADFKEPYFFDYDIGMGLSGFSTRSDRFDYSEERRGGSVTFSRRFDDWSIGLKTQAENIKISDVEDTTATSIRQVKGHNQLRTLAPYWALDLTNDPIFPTGGLTLRLDLEHTGTFLQGDHDFRKAQIDGDAYITLWEPDPDNVHVLHLGYKTAWVKETGDSSFVPVFDRYFAGGRGSIRGYEYRQVGPREGGDPVGGEGLMTATAEYNFPLYKRILRGVFFMDSAALTEEYREMRLKDHRLSAGWGIRFQIPWLLGPVPIALDFGYALREDEFPLDEEEIFSFSIGRFF